MKRFVQATTLLLGLGLLLPTLASAHVVVTPAQASVGEEQLFSISSPNERQDAITQVVLAIPAGVTSVTPTAVVGWTITTAASSSNKDEVGSITWSGGSIPVGQRADFTFEAQLPANATTIAWKAYQTYADGTVVHWDQLPSGSDDSQGSSGPYSQTKVTNSQVTPAATDSSNTNQWALIVACAALIVSVAALLQRVRK